MTLSNNWPNGVGSSTGDVLGTCKPLYLSGTIYFVSSVIGNDSNDGGDQLKPKATLGGAVSASTGGDMIVLAANHNETLLSQVVITTDVTVVGLGSASGVPTAKLRRGFDGSMLAMSGANSQLRNVYIDESTLDSTAANVAVSNAGARIQDCYFACGAHDKGPCVSGNGSASYLEIKDTKFVVTSTTTQPSKAFGVSAGFAGLRLFGVTIDGGSVGWSNYYALDLSGFAVTGIRMESLSLLRGSDVRAISTTTGYVNPQTATGASKVLVA